MAVLSAQILSEDAKSLFVSPTCQAIKADAVLLESPKYIFFHPSVGDCRKQDRRHLRQYLLSEMEGMEGEFLFSHSTRLLQVKVEFHRVSWGNVVYSAPPESPVTES
jgi:hypothetical protein